MDVETVRHLLHSRMRPVGSERIALPDAVGRIASEPVHALLTAPAHDTAAMDGFALNFSDLAGCEGGLSVSGVSRAGERSVPLLEAGTCMRIFTGAPLPRGADTVVAQEDVRRTENGIVFPRPPVRGRHVRKTGANFFAGDPLLASGHSLTARDVGMLAAAGHSSVAVRRKPRVAVLSTGDELGSLPDCRPHLQIPDANRPALLGLLKAWQCEPIDLGIARDDDGSIIRSIEAHVRDVDLVVVSGGASVGDHDRVHSALGAMGFALDVHQVRMKPGKPLMFGTLGSTPVLALPGNPVSAMICAFLFLRAAISGLQATGNAGPPLEKATLLAPLPQNGYRDEYRRANMSLRQGMPTVTPLPQQDTAMIARLAMSNCLLFRPANAPPAETGSIVDIIRLDAVPGF